MNLPKEYDVEYREYIDYINKIKKHVNSILRKSRFIVKTESISLDNVEKNDNIDLDREIKKSKCKRYIFLNNDTYIGKVINGNMEGSGVYIFSTEDDTEMKYIGDFKESIKEGMGLFILSNGEEYIGGFENDLREGIGSIKYKSKDEYIGNWVGGHKHGRGIYTWADGSMYIGEFKKSKMDGFGVCYDKHGRLIYSGDWKNNLIHGNGEFIWEEGKKYIGEFQYGKKHGNGSFYLNNEIVYDGTWKYDKPSILNRSLDEIFSIRL